MNTHSLFHIAKQLSAILLALVCITAPSALAQTTNTTHSWNVLDAGAIADGSTDCTPIFQKLLNDAGKAGGGVVDVPAGRFRINGNLSIPANGTLQGIFRGRPPPQPLPAPNLRGSGLLAFAGRRAA